ncbi:MAG: TAXI family TRAP transporter solute-binding subunit [Alphaproteobacteria bacterium]
MSRIAIARTGLRALPRRLGALCLLALMALGAAPILAQDVTFFRIGTGSTGGTYFPIGGLIANAISNPPGSRPCDRGGSCGPPGLIAVAQSTQGSVDNVEAIRSGQLESGLVQADIAYWAYKGEQVFAGKERKVESLRAIANLYPEAIHLVVRANSGIKSVADLRGKRVSVGKKESGTRVDAEIILGAYGLTAKRIKAHYLSPGPAADALREGKLDAFFLVAGAPAAAITELASTIEIALVPIAGKRIEKLIKRFPFFSHGTIAGGAYRGVGETSTLSVGAQWVVSAKVSADVVYGITKALWHANTRKLLDRGHPKGKTIRIENALRGIGIPLHPGAERFYREVGRIKAPAPAPKIERPKPAKGSE